MNRFNKLALAGAVGSLMAGPGVDAATPSFSLYKYASGGNKLADAPLPGNTDHYPYEQYLADGWSGAPPDYKGGLPATWYVPLAATDSAVVETADMPAWTIEQLQKGIAPRPDQMAISFLNVGSEAYVNNRYPDSNPAHNWGHTADFGLFLLDAASDVTITLSSDPLLINRESRQGAKVAAGLRPGFSVWQGWDTVGGTRHGTWLPNGYPALQPGAPRPFLSSWSMAFPSEEQRPQPDLGQFMGTAWTYTSGGSAVLKLTNVPAGKYTIVMGGVTDAAAGATEFPGASKQYKASFRTAPAGSRPSAARSDLNGNGKADLVWRNTLTGETELWSMDGSRRQERTTVEAQPKPWVIAATADFDGDGETDMLWRNPASGQNTIWLMNGGSVADKIDLPNQAIGFVVMAVDFQNDRQAEILWLDPASGEISVWLVHKGHFGVEVRRADRAPIIPTALAGRDLVAIADFNGNGTPDFWWRDGATGDNTLWLLSGIAYESPVGAPNQGSAWSLAGTGDFDGDGIADAVWRNDQTGDNEIWLMGEGGTRKSAVSLPKLAKAWTLARVDDFDGDGQVDLFWRHQRTGKNRLWTMEGTAPKSRRNVPEIGKAWTTPPD